MRERLSSQGSGKGVLTDSGCLGEIVPFQRAPRQIFDSEAVTRPPFPLRISRRATARRHLQFLVLPGVGLLLRV